MLPAGPALPKFIGGGTAVARGTNRAHNGSEDCQDCNDHIDSAGSNCKPHHCETAHHCARHTLRRLIRSRCAHRAVVLVCPTHSFASHFRQQASPPQPSVCCRPRCVALNTVTSSLYKLTRNVWIRMYKSVSSSMPTSQDCAVFLSSSGSHTSWTVEICISRCGSSSTVPSIKRNLAP